MSKTIVFIQGEGAEELVEAELAEATFDGLHDALTRLGLEIGEEVFLFLDEAEEPLKGKGKNAVPGLKPGARIHVSRCRKIAVTVNYLHRTEEHNVAPGTRVKRVKKWVIDKFGLEGPDAAEHVLQLCDSTDRPASDNPLQRLADRKQCAVCFDLVPEKRVEG
jgi:hypothetical protein